MIARSLRSSDAAPALPASLASAFQGTAAELGWCSAARLFTRELAAAGGCDLVARAADQLGRAYPVFACVAQRAIDGNDRGVDAQPIVDALSGVRRLLVVGLESDFLDALVPRLPNTTIGVVTLSDGLDTDWRRVLANYGGRVVPVALGEVQDWSGRHSAILTFVYGTDDHMVHVAPAWLRVSGSDVRAQFRSLVGWDVMGSPMALFPRWLVSTGANDFSHLIRP